MKHSLLKLATLAAVLLMPLTAFADSVTPASYSATLGIGESVTIAKTVTIDTAPPTSALLDVSFLFDTTGSMYSLLNTATSAASSITTNLSSFGDVAFSVGHYEDFVQAGTYWGSSGNVPYELVQDMGTAAQAQTAIASLSAYGGNDYPESNLYGLQQTATQTSWRADSNRVVVWFGDAPAHDPVDTPGYPGPTITQTIDALTGENITVIAIDLSGMNSQGEATAITSATGGSLYSGTPSPTTIAALITSLVEETFSTYNEVTLQVDPVLAGLDVAIDPSAYVGDFDRSVTRSFDFDVTFTALAAGTYDFSIHALVDKGIVATERDHITVSGEPAPVPEPSTFLLLGSGLLGLGFYRRRKNKNS